MKILYKTNNIDLVRKLSYKEDKEYFELYFNRENVDKAIELMKELDDFVIVLIGINKSNVATYCTRELRQRYIYRHNRRYSKACTII